MGKTIILSLATFLLTSPACAQLFVNYSGNVGIATETEEFEPFLMVGDHSFFEGSNISIGVAATPEVKANKSNISVSGVVDANSSNTSDKNHGVLGIVESTNTSHGRNYGLCGMAGNSGAGSTYGGAGIYGSSYDYSYSSPQNISGIYAGYFSGNVHTTGNMTSSSVYLTADSRQREDVEPLGGNGRSGSTLSNLLGMNVVEYSLKSSLGEFSSDGIDPADEDALRAEYEYLKKEDQKQASRRHYGIDARELREVYPGLVHESKDGSLSVNYLEMVPLLIRSLQELKQEIDEVKEE